jgi:hypothetical protein
MVIGFIKAELLDTFKKRELYVMNSSPYSQTTVTPRAWVKGQISSGTMAEQTNTLCKTGRAQYGVQTV